MIIGPLLTAGKPHEQERINPKNNSSNKYFKNLLRAAQKNLTGGGAFVKLQLNQKNTKKIHLGQEYFTTKGKINE